MLSSHPHPSLCDSLSHTLQELLEWALIKDASPDHILQNSTHNPIPISLYLVRLYYFLHCTCHIWFIQNLFIVCLPQPEWKPHEDLVENGDHLWLYEFDECSPLTSAWLSCLLQKTFAQKRHGCKPINNFTAYFRKFPQNNLSKTMTCSPGQTLCSSTMVYLARLISRLSLVSVGQSWQIRSRSLSNSIWKTLLKLLEFRPQSPITFYFRLLSGTLLTHFWPETYYGHRR